MSYTYTQLIDGAVKCDTHNKILINNYPKSINPYSSFSLKCLASQNGGQDHVFDSAVDKFNLERVDDQSLQKVIDNYYPSCKSLQSLVENSQGEDLFLNITCYDRGRTVIKEHLQQHIEQYFQQEEYAWNEGVCHNFYRYNSSGECYYLTIDYANRQAYYKRLKTESVC